MRVLFTGLGFFATALALAILPVVAQGGPVNPNVPCTITGTDSGEILIGTPGRDVILRPGWERRHHGQGRRRHRQGRGRGR